MKFQLTSVFLVLLSASCIFSDGGITSFFDPAAILPRILRFYKLLEKTEGSADDSAAIKESSGKAISAAAECFQKDVSKYAEKLEKVGQDISDAIKEEIQFTTETPAERDGPDEGSANPIAQIAAYPPIQKLLELIQNSGKLAEIFNRPNLQADMSTVMETLKGFFEHAMKCGEESLKKELPQETYDKIIAAWEKSGQPEAA